MGFLDLLPPDGNTIVRVFGLKAFIESLLKIGLGYLSFHGTPEQSELPTQAKVVFLMTFLNWKLSEQSTAPKEQLDKWKEWDKAETQGGRKSLRTELRYMATRGYHPAHPMKRLLQTRGRAADPMQRLLKSKGTDEEQARKDSMKRAADNTSPLAQLLDRRPKLFAQPDDVPELGDSSFERCVPCSACKLPPQEGWGSPACSKCGLGDEILRACLANDAPESMPVLSPIVSLLGTKFASLCESADVSKVLSRDVSKSMSEKRSRT